MAPNYDSFWLPSRGNKPEEYQDAFAAAPDASRFAVADGASESGFAGEWAGLMVEDFVAHARPELDRWNESLPALQESWQTTIGSQSLPWFAKAKFQRGAFATFLGVVVDAPADDDLQWRAVAVGDACLFHCRGEDLLTAFPLERADEFNNYPSLVGSRTLPDHVRDELCLYATGTWQADDRLWLMTDALAQWCLAQLETGHNPWDELESVRTSSESEKRFATWIAERRETGDLHNDDVTLMAINL